MDRLTATRVFVAVVDQGSLTQAADALDMSTAMVSRYLAAMETWLDARLLHRTTRRISLTDAGQSALVSCRQLLELSEDLQGAAGAAGREPGGRLRVACSQSFAQAQLAPALVDFQRLHPKVSIALVVAERAVDLAADRIDLAVRITNALEPALISRRLATCKSVVCASPAYLREHGAPRRVADLAKHRVLNHSLVSTAQFRLGPRAVAQELAGIEVFSSNDTSALRSAVLAGAGLASHHKTHRTRQPRRLKEHTMTNPSTNPNQALWEKGDFTRIATAMRDSGTALVQSIGIARGMQVLDLGCGDGTTALPAARLGANVLGVDIARNLVEAGNARAQAEGLANLRFEQGDATNLSSLENGTFDCVVSIFGAMFAPKPLDVAREMVRVTRRGGRIVMGNWIPGDPTLVAQILKIASAYTPPPPEGFVSPMTWGVEANVVERFGAAGVASKDINCTPSTYTFDFDGTPVAFVDEFRRYYGPTMNAFDAAQKNGKADALREELERLFTSQNQSTTAGRTSIPATFLRVEVRVK